MSLNEEIESRHGNQWIGISDGMLVSVEARSTRQRNLQGGGTIYL